MPELVPTWLTNIVERYRSRNLSMPERTLKTFNQGIRNVDQGKHKSAIKRFSEAIEASPNSAKLHHYRADAYALNGDYDLAIIDFDKAVRLNPSYPDTYLDRGNSRYQLGQLTEAVRDFSEAIRLKPAWGEAYANRAVAHAELSNSAESDHDARKAISLGISEDRLAQMLEAARSNASSPAN